MNSRGKPSIKQRTLEMLVFAFLLFIAYAIYISVNNNRKTYYYDSDIVIQYANVYHLMSVLYYSTDDPKGKWDSELVKLSFKDINEFCELTSNDIQSSVDHSILKGKMVPMWIKNDEVAIATAVTEFECSKGPT